METKSSHEEIDILEVLVKIVDQLRSAMLLTIILPLAGGICGFLLVRNVPEKVVSDMMVTTDLLSEEQCNFLLNQFAVSEQIQKITPETSNDFVNVTHEVIRPFRYFTDDRTVHLKISLTLRDRSSFPAFQQAMLDFLEKSPAATSRKKAIQEYEAKVIEGIDHELAAIEKMKTDVSGKDALNSLNAGDLYVETITLLDKKLQLQTRIASGKVFSVVEGFTNVVYQKPSPLIWTIAGVGAGLLLLFMLLAIRYFIGYYRNHNRARN